MYEMILKLLHLGTSRYLSWWLENTLAVALKTIESFFKVKMVGNAVA